MNCALFLSGKPRPVGGELHLSRRPAASIDNTTTNTCVARRTLRARFREVGEPRRWAVIDNAYNSMTSGFEVT